MCKGTIHFHTPATCGYLQDMPGGSLNLLPELTHDRQYIFFLGAFLSSFSQYLSRYKDVITPGFGSFFSFVVMQLSNPNKDLITQCI